MKVPNIILVEDDKMLQTVFTMFINDIGYNLEKTFILPKDAIKYLENNTPDIILMDITFPGEMSGIEASKIINKKHNIPIIYLSSNTDDKIINQAIDTNPYGYLVKPIDKTKLKITIDIALSKSYDKNSKNLLNSIINNVNLGIFTLNDNYDIICWNKKSEEIFKKQIKDVVNKNIELVLPDINFRQNILSQLEKNNSFVANVEINNSLLKLEFNKIIIDKKQTIVCSAFKQDSVTAPDKNTDKLKLKALFDSSIESIILVDKDLNIVDYNGLTEKYLNTYFSKNIKKGDKILDALSFLNNKELQYLINNTLEGVSHYLERIINVRDKNKYFKITIYPISDENNNINLFYITLYEITKLKEIEEKYKNIKSELKPLFESSIQRFYLCDLDYKLVSFNKAAQLIIYSEYNRHLKAGDNILDFVPDEIGRESFKKRFEEAKKGEHIVFKEKIQLKNNEYWNETHLDPILNEQGEIYRVLLWTLDITESENNIQALKQSQERYALVAMGGNDGIWDWNIKTNEIYLSPRWKEILGYDKNDKLEKYGIHDKLTHPDDLETAKKTLEEYLSGKTQEYYVEIRLKSKSGEYIWVAERGACLRDDKGTPYRIAGSITNISYRKEKEKELQELTKTLLEERNMFLKGDIIINRIKADEKANFTFISDNVKELLGYDKTDFLENKLSFFDIIHPDDKKNIEKIRLDAFYNKKDTVEFPYYRLIKKNKDFVWVKNYATIIKDDNNIPIEFFGYFINISDKISAEEKLMENKLKFEKLFTEASDAILIIKDNKITDFNNKAIELFRYNAQEFKKIALEKLSYKNQEKNEHFEEIFKLVKQGEKQTFYWKFNRKDNSTFDAEVSLTSISLKNEILLQAIIRDITLRKSMEKALKENEEKIKSIYDAIPDLIFIIDKNGDYLDYKPDAQGILEVPREDIIGKNLVDFFGKEKTKEILEKINETIKTGVTGTYEYYLDSNIGKRRFESRITKINNNSILSIVRDVTEQKQKTLI